MKIYNTLSLHLWFYNYTDQHWKFLIQLLPFGILQRIFWVSLMYYSIIVFIFVILPTMILSISNVLIQMTCTDTLFHITLKRGFGIHCLIWNILIFYMLHEIRSNQASHSPINWVIIYDIMIQTFFEEKPLVTQYTIINVSCEIKVSRWLMILLVPWDTQNAVWM